MIQYIIVGVILIVCVAFVVRTFVRTIMGRDRTCGSCGSDGCKTIPKTPEKKP